MIDPAIIKASTEKKCRFCGGKDLDLVRQNENLICGERGFPGGICYFAECLGCRARGPVSETQEQALAKWVAQKR